jgi:hypothetical protein
VRKVVVNGGVRGLLRERNGRPPDKEVRTVGKNQLDDDLVGSGLLQGGRKSEDGVSGPGIAGVVPHIHETGIRRLRSDAPLPSRRRADKCPRP